MAQATTLSLAILALQVEDPELPAPVAAHAAAEYLEEWPNGGGPLDAYLDLYVGPATS